jgi:hypothetical protein
MGFPSVLEGQGGRYQRNEYMWNLCFVFEATAATEAFEPVVRKCGRILRSAEVCRLGGVVDAKAENIARLDVPVQLKSGTHNLAGSYGTALRGSKLLQRDEHPVGWLQLARAEAVPLLS